MRGRACAISGKDRSSTINPPMAGADSSSLLCECGESRGELDSDEKEDEGRMPVGNSDASDANWKESARKQPSGQRCTDRSTYGW